MIVSLAAVTTYVRAESVSFAVISDHKADHAGLEKALTFLAAQRVDFIIVAGDCSPLRDAYGVLGDVHCFILGINYHEPKSTNIPMGVP